MKSRKTVSIMWNLYPQQRKGEKEGDWQSSQPTISPKEIANRDSLVWKVLGYIRSSQVSLSTSRVSYFVGALSPVSHKGLHQGWKQTSLYLKVIHFTSHHAISHVFFKNSIYIPWALNTGTCIQQGDLFYSAGLHRKHVLATANAGKNRKRF